MKYRIIAITMLYCLSSLHAKEDSNRKLLHEQYTNAIDAIRAKFNTVHQEQKPLLRIVGQALSPENLKNINLPSPAQVLAIFRALTPQYVATNIELQRQGLEAIVNLHKDPQPFPGQNVPLEPYEVVIERVVTGQELIIKRYVEVAQTPEGQEAISNMIKEASHEDLVLMRTTIDRYKAFLVENHVPNLPYREAYFAIWDQALEGVA